MVPTTPYPLQIPTLTQLLKSKGHSAYLCPIPILQLQLIPCHLKTVPIILTGSKEVIVHVRIVIVSGIATVHRLSGVNTKDAVSLPTVMKKPMGNSDVLLLKCMWTEVRNPDYVGNYSHRNSSIPTPWNEDTSVYSGTPLFQHPEMRTPLYTVKLLYSNTLKWGHLCIQWNSSIPTPWNEDTSVYSGTPLFQHPEMRTPLYTVELLYSNTLKWGHLCIQWNSSIPTPWNEDTSVYSGTPLFQHPEMRTPLYTVKLLYSNTLKWGHLCIQWNSSIPTPWNEDTSVYSGTPLFQPPEMRTPLYTVELLYSNSLKWGHLCI